METTASLPRRLSHQLGGVAFAWPRLGVPLALTLLIAVSFAIRSIAWWHKATPSYFPDEYLYAELGRSLADTASPVVRGVETSFPALLQPILTAPFWLVDDVALSYHLVQVFATLVMSLVALPVYLLARRLDLGLGLALGCAAFALAVPDFLYGSRILAEPFAYPLALGAVATGTLALARGGARRQVLFLALVALAVLARVQFVILPLAYVAAAVTVGLRERALLRVVREQRLLLIVFGVGLAVSVTRPALVGQYDAFLDVDAGTGLAVRLATNAFGLAYIGGWLLLPGALLGLVLALARPRSREELSFAALSAGLTLGLLGEASAYGDLDRIQERYFFYALPLIVLLFALYASRGWPQRRVHAFIAACALAVVAVVPLTFATAATGKVQSPFLFAAFRFEQALGNPGTGALALATAVSALLAAALVCSFRPRPGTAVALGLATAFCAFGSLGAAVLDIENTTRVRKEYLPAKRSWIDRTGLEDVALLHPFTAAGDTYQQLFWNRSVTSLLMLPGIALTDAYHVERVSVARDGTLLSGGRPVIRPLVIDEYAGRIELRGAVPMATAPALRLWRPTGVPRLRFMADGYFDGGWLGHAGTFRVWPSTPSGRVAGRISFRATPDFRTTLTFRSAVGRRAHRLAPGRAATITIPVCSRGSRKTTFESSQSGWKDGHFVSTAATTPTWTADPHACGPAGATTGPSTQRDLAEARPRYRLGSDFRSDPRRGRSI
jgi:hypothetical protein